MFNLSEIREYPRPFLEDLPNPYNFSFRVNLHTAIVPPGPGGGLLQDFQEFEGNLVVFRPPTKVGEPVVKTEQILEFTAQCYKRLLEVYMRGDQENSRIMCQPGLQGEISIGDRECSFLVQIRVRTDGDPAPVDGPAGTRMSCR